MAFEPQVNVVRIPLQEAGDGMISTELGQGGLGLSDEVLRGFIINAQVNDVLQAMRETAEAAYLLSWQGSTRVPRGAQIGSHVIAWTQHGFVQDDKGSTFGVYERLKDVDGPDRDSEMLVFLNQGEGL